MTREVAITNRHPRLRLDRRAIEAAVAVLDAHAGKFLGGCPTGELSLVFLTTTALARVHGDFMGDPTATDVITFAADPTSGLAGEICVSVDTAMRYVQSNAAGGLARRSSAERSVGGDFSAELTLYLVHGWLHLAGYDDRSSAKKRRMRAAEQRAMALLRMAKAVPVFRLG